MRCETHATCLTILNHLLYTPAQFGSLFRGAIKNCSPPSVSKGYYCCKDSVSTWLLAAFSLVPITLLLCLLRRWDYFSFTGQGFHGCSFVTCEEKNAASCFGSAMADMLPWRRKSSLHFSVTNRARWQHG